MSTDSEIMREAVADAVTSALPAALKSAARDPETWAAMQDGWTTHLGRRAGNWLLRQVWTVIGRVLLFLAAGSLVYAMGGWSAVAELFKMEPLK